MQLPYSCGGYKSPTRKVSQTKQLKGKEGVARFCIHYPLVITVDNKTENKRKLFWKIDSEILRERARTPCAMRNQKFPGNERKTIIIIISRSRDASRPYAYRKHIYGRPTYAHMHRSRCVPAPIEMSKTVDNENDLIEISGRVAAALSRAIAFKVKNTSAAGRVEQFH